MIDGYDTATGLSDRAQQQVRSRLSLEDYFVDFLGGLVPGVLFLVATTIAVLPALHALAASLNVDGRNQFTMMFTEFLDKMDSTSTAFWLILFFGLLLIAYVIGHLFYRFDPKEADRSSFLMLVKDRENYDNEDRGANLGCLDERSCQFPYPLYHKYLERRGLKHLIPFAKVGLNRSKNYINLLKIRLRFHHPEKCGIITRNEAHVRLASSTWFLVKMLSRISWYALGFSALALALSIIFRYIFHNHDLNWMGQIAWHLPSLLCPALVLLFGMFARNLIRRFLHYQRMREVFHLYETAFTAFRGKFHLLDPPFDSVALDKAAKHLDEAEEEEAAANTTASSEPAQESH